MDCCDLLSKCIFDLLIFNLTHWYFLWTYVVICFQNVSLIYWYSTKRYIFANLSALWFAFKMYLWFIDIQLLTTHSISAVGCDLLSKCIFDLLIFNYHNSNEKHCCVVICFQNVSLIYWYSTAVFAYWLDTRLWFAFKMYLWFIDIQLILPSSLTQVRCDLLSKCIFDLLIFNNWLIYKVFV